MVEVASTKRLFTNQFRSIDEVTYTRNGKQHKWIMSPGHDTVHILVYNTDTDKLLLVQQLRIPVLVNSPTNSATTVETCAGLIDKYESYAPTPNRRARMVAIEEVQEELGYRVNLDDLLQLPPYIGSTGGSGNTCHPFYCEVTDDQFVGQQLGEHEDIEVYELSPEQVNWFLLAQSNTDATTRYLLQWWLLNQSGTDNTEEHY